MDVLDVFRGDPFTVRALTDAINKVPFIPGRAGIVIDWVEGGVHVANIMLEEKAGFLTLINPSARGGPGISVRKTDRKARSLSIPHYQIDDGIYADEVQGVREFGSDSQLETVVSKVNERMQEHSTLRLDPTLEYQRMGAIKGLILNADGSTLYDLFEEFDVSQQTEVDFNLDAASDDGMIRSTCDGVTRMIARTLGGQPYREIRAFCSDTFWDGLIRAKEVRATYLSQQEAAQLRSGTAFQTFNFGGIVWENYRGGIGGVDENEEVETAFVEADKAHIFPVGVPGLWRTVNAPADYIETVNTVGLPRYSKQYPMADGKGVHLQVQSNSLSYCTRPRVLIKAKRT